MRFKRDIRFLGYRLYTNTFLYKDKRLKTRGVYDRCEDGSKVLFADYDNIKLEYLIGELIKLQEKHGLSDFIILESSINCYHAVCFDKMTSKENNEILSGLSIDTLYKQSSDWDKGARVLRIESKGKIPKPKYIYTLESKCNIRQKSKAHIDFFKNWYSIKNTNRKAQDNLDSLFFVEYLTKDNIKLKNDTKNIKGEGKN